MKGLLRLAAVLTVAVVFAGCDDDEPTGAGGPFDLVFQGTNTYGGPHGGHGIYVAVVRSSDGVVVARDDGTVSATANPAFSFTFTNLLQAGTAYEIHYWIDSNFAAGTVGVCDPQTNDHQWNLAVAAPTQDVTVTEIHDASDLSPVCDTFAADLTFSGNATYNAPHGGHAIEVAIVRASDGAIVGTASGTVSATANPAFSFSFPGALVIGFAYQIHYWIDSNFGDGTVGVCDEPGDDHQWNLPVATVAGDVNVTEVHDASDQSSVCTTFD